MLGMVLADDATGALECGSVMAGLGLRPEVVLGGSSRLSRVDYLVVDAETRHLSAEKAAELVVQWAALAGSAPVYKKTDSTLRGNVGAELGALQNAYPDRPLVYVPAYPALGRTVVGGQLLVNRVPVAETAFGTDARQPVKSSLLQDLFSDSLVMADADQLRAALEAGERRILICDACCEADLDLIAAVIAGREVNVAGTGGFVRHWVKSRGVPMGKVRVLAKVQDWVVVCGSLHPQSRRQAEVATRHGMLVITSSEAVGISAPEDVAGELALRTVEAMSARPGCGVMVFGGDTAFAIWKLLGVTQLEALPEVMPGIACCRVAGHENLYVTKAGGFGGDRLALEVQERLR